MKRIGWALVLVAMMAGAALAAQDAEANGEDFAKLISEVSLLTYAGLAALTTLLISGLKTMWKKKIKGKEPIIAMAAPLLIGAIVKAAGIGFEEVAWVAHITTLLIADGIGSQMLHDKLINPFLKKATNPKPADPPS